MTAVTTSGKKAAGTSAAPAKKTTQVVELGKEFGPIFDELSVVSLARKEHEDREKQLKEAILAALPEPSADVTLAVRVGKAIRAKVNLRKRTNISAKDLQAAFPEAYEATKSETEYTVIQPA